MEYLTVFTNWWLTAPLKEVLPFTCFGLALIIMPFIGGGK